MRRILISFVLLLTCALVLAGCGGSSKSKSKNTSSNASTSVPGAEIAPATGLGFISISTDSTGAQWQEAMKLLARIPAFQTSINKSLATSGVTLDELGQALGANTDVVLLGDAKKPLTVMLTEPKDAAKLTSLLGKGSGPKPVTAKVGSWLAVADTQAALDKFQSEAAKGKLSDSSTFKEAIAELPSDALVKVYLSGATITKALVSLASSSSTSSSSSGSSLSLSPKSLKSMIEKNQLDWAAISASAVPDGLSLSGVFKGQKTLTNASMSLIDELPSGVSFAVDLNGKSLGLDKAVANLRNNAKYGSQITQVETLLGVKLEDVAALVGSEMAVYGTGTGIGVLIKAPDPAKATLLVNKVVGLLTAQLGGKSNKVTIGGTQASELTIGTLHLYVGIKDGNLFLTTDTAALPGSSALSSDSVYTAATKILPIPSANDGVLFLDFKQLAVLGQSSNSLVQSLSKSFKSGLSQGTTAPSVTEMNAGVQSLASLLGYIATNGDKVELKALLTVK